MKTSACAPTIRRATTCCSSPRPWSRCSRALVNHTREHFTAEGQLMRATHYRGLPEHEAEHHRVLGELQQLNRTLKRGHLPLVRAYVKEGLPEWFDTHLAMMDGALAMHLKKSA